MESSKIMFVVMSIYPFSGLEVQGKPLMPGESHPTHFLPAFHDRKDAVKWCNGREDMIREIRVDSID